MARGAVLALTILALHAPAVAAQGTPTVKVVSNGGPVFHTEAISPNTIKTFTVTCPPGHLAFGGSVAVPGNNVTLLKSAPGPGAKSWVFTIGSPVTNGPDHVTVQVNCYKPALPGGGGKVKVKLKTAKSKLLTVAAGGTVQTKVKCPAGTAPVAPGEEEKVPGLTPKSTPRAAQAIPSPGQAARWTAVKPVRGGFEFTAKNPEPAGDKVVRARAECIGRRARRRNRRRRRPRVRIVRLASEGTAQPGSGIFFERCPKRHVPLSGGWSYPSSKDVLFTGTETSRRHRFLWMLQNGTGQPQDMDLFLLCTRGRIKFDKNRP